MQVGQYIPNKITVILDISNNNNNDNHNNNSNLRLASSSWAIWAGKCFSLKTWTLLKMFTVCLHIGVSDKKLGEK